MNKKSLIIGTGLTGQSIMQYLQTQGVDFDVFDTRQAIANLDKLKSAYPKAQFILGAISEVDWASIDHVWTSPGISPSDDIIQQAIKNGGPVGGDLELFSRQQSNTPIIAITGTNGKSTLVTLITEILRHLNLNVALAGNIGEPMLNINPQTFDYIVLELSSFQLYYQENFKADIACILNVSEDHIDWHGTYEAYVEAKQRIYHNAKHCVFNAEDKNTYPTTKNNLSSFSINGNTDAQFTFDKQSQAFLKEDKALLYTNQLQLTGTHNFEDILAALTIIDKLPIDISQGLEAVKCFTGLPHRTQLARELNGIKWINDSKGTNVGATLAAVKGLSAVSNGKIIWLAGGQGKGADFSPLAPLTAEHVRHAILFGEDKDKIAKAIGNETKYTFVDTLKEAIKQAQKQAQKNDCVLFSPACASFDMFPNYLERGEAFIEAVNAII